MANGSFEPINKPARIVDAAAMAAVQRGYCEFCGRYFDPASGEVHGHHFKSRGAGGADSHSNVYALCWRCHGRAHTGEISRVHLGATVAWRRGVSPAVGASE